MSKGNDTREEILDAALSLASVHGLEGVTIGGLARQLSLSKSGLFAHFGSKEELQIATLDEAAQRYTALVFMPAMREPRGLKRLIKLLDNWLHWTKISGLKACPMMSASAEFDDKPGAMHDAVAAHMQRLNQELMRSIQQAIDTGELAPDTDPELLAFEIFGVIASCYRSRNLFLDKNANHLAQRAFNRLLSSALASPETPAKPQARATRSRSKTSPTA